MSRREKTQKQRNKAVHISIIVFVTVIILILAGMIIFRYQVEGESNAIFDISKILVVSTAEGVEKQSPSAKWDYTINQDNDIYITIEKNQKKQDAIKQITIDNIQILEAPLKGKIQIFKPAETGLFKCKEEYKIQDELKYSGSKSGSLNNLEISNQGGTVIIRFCNENVAEYTSNEEEQIIHDGTLLSKTEVKEEELKSKIQFDIIIETESNIKYKATINLDLPVPNFIENGTSTKEINKEDIILKRI